MAFAFAFDLQLFAGEKTEEPTSKRRNDARKKGQVGRSQELSAAIVLLAGFSMIKAMGESIYQEIANYTVYILNHLDQPIDTETVMQLLLGIMSVLAKTALPIMFAVMVAGLAINVYQVGWKISTEAMSFNISKLNPISGMKKFFSKRALVELVKCLLKIFIIGSLIYDDLASQIMDMPKFIYYDLQTGLSQIAGIVLALAFKICAIFLVLAILDYCYQKWQTTQDLKMSKQEVKEEFKQMEGDPQIKGKIKRKQMEMAMARMMQEVPQADVIVTNPTHLAVALKYEQGMVAPQVVAKGKDLVAQRIKEIAREAHVTIFENKPLARALYETVEIGDVVPQELYKAVAEVLAYVYRLKNRVG